MEEIHFLVKENKIDKDEIDTIVSVIFNSLSASENGNVEELLENNAFLETATRIVNRFIKNHAFESKKDKLRLIHIADKMSTQKELLNLQKGILSNADIQSAGAHLGNKAQSAFDSK